MKQMNNRRATALLLLFLIKYPLPELFRDGTYAKPAVPETVVPYPDKVRDKVEAHRPVRKGHVAR